MVMNNKDRTIQILSSFSFMMLIFISIINPQDHSILYHFFTWLTWPTIFFIAGYSIDVNLKIGQSIFLAVKRYLVPYLSAGLLMIVMNKVVQLLQLNTWLNTPFPAMRTGLKALLYGNGSPVVTIFGFFDTGIGLLWLLIALFTGTLLMIFISKIKKMFWAVLIIILLGGLGFYLATFIQIPWSLESALIALPFMLFGVYYQKLDNWSAGSATVLAALIVHLTMSASTGLDMIVAYTPFWILGTLTGLISLAGVIVVASSLTKNAALTNLFAKIGSYLSLNLVVFIFINTMIPINNYIGGLLPTGMLSFIIIWLIMLIISTVIKFGLVKILKTFSGQEGELDEKIFR